MRYVMVSALGVAATIAFIGASMTMNYLYGISLGRTPLESQLWGIVSVASDALKAVSPIFLFWALRARQFGLAFVCLVGLAITTGYALQSAAGFASESKNAVLGGREIVRASYLETEKEIAELAARRAAITMARSAAEIDAAIKATLAKPVMENGRVRGTVGVISTDCTRADVRTAEACAEVGKLREDLATAATVARIDQRLGELRKEARTLRDKGGALDANPPATLLSRLTFGWLSPADVEAWRSIYLAILVEFVSVFGLLMSLEHRALSAAWSGLRGGAVPADVAAPAPLATRAPPTARLRRPAAADAGETTIVGSVTNGGAARLLAAPADDGSADARKSIGDVGAFVFERLAPASSGGLSLTELHTEYRKWCKAAKRQPVARDEFALWFETVGKSVGLAVKMRGEQLFCDDVQLAA